MHLVILVKDKSLASKIEKDVSANLEVGVVSVHSTDDCMGLFEILPDIEVIVFDDFYKASLLSSIKSKQHIVDLVYIGDKKVADAQLNVHCFSPQENIEEFLKGNMGHPKQLFNLIDDKEHYYPILTTTLKVMKKTPVDLYIRMKKDTYFHYIKYIHGGSEITEAEFKKLDSVKKVFIKKDDKTEFFDQMNAAFVDILGGEPASCKKSAESVREEIFKELISVGLTDRQLKVAEVAIKNVMSSLSKGLLSEIKSVYSSDASFNYRKSYMTSIMCTSISKNLSWITEDNKCALVLASFFNDRELIRDSMHYIDSEYGLEVSDYTADEKKSFLSHAQKSADWVKQQKNIPQEVERIVRQHHGSIVGVGFEEELNAQITKLTMVFMVAEAFSLDILKSKDGKFDVKSSLEKINEKYKNKGITDIIQVLFKTLKT